MDFCSWYFKSFRVLVCGLLLLSSCFLEFESNAQPLPQHEVKALQAISAQLKNLNWNVHQNSCIKGDGFFNDASNGKYSAWRKVVCTCSPDSCSVTNIELKRLNLVGVLPAAFANLTRLHSLDLTRNFISGSIPREFGRIPFVLLSMSGNRLSGQIPLEIGDIASLEELILHNNQLGGSLPKSLEKLSHLRRLFLSANNITGSIPESYANLRNLTEFRIDGNDISGKLPEFIGNWTNLKILEIQGTSIENPIPRAISKLTNLEELRISDLKGPRISFPNLSQLTSLNVLVLRNCLIEDTIPGYIGQFKGLQTLDLSFNRLSGPIPQSFENLLTYVTQFMFLTDNSLSGQLLSSIANSQRNIDLSYNSFTGPPDSSCQRSNVNLVSSHSTTTNESVSWCLRKGLPCPSEARLHSLFINCGGQNIELDGNTYEEDVSQGGKSNFFSSSGRWGYSSTGVFIDDNDDGILYTASSNVSSLGIYATARLAPLSLKYYGFCLRSGSYNVKLHFAEIMFTADQTYKSLGKRIFDVSIQGNVVKKDFNIVEEAGGVGKSYILEEPNIMVNGSTLEIHLYWAGKGTNAIPERGVYGPLISAISVTSNSVDFDLKNDGGLSSGAVAGIVVGTFVFVVLVLIALRRKFGKKDTGDNDLRAIELKSNCFSLRQIEAATNNFDSAYKIGEGGFGPVYKGVLSDGTLIAVKQQSAKSSQGTREFVTEVGMISALQHPNLVKLYGCCIDENQLLLIYEYMENNSLARALFGPEEHQLQLGWPVRMNICLGIAKGLAYLHEECRLKIVHRDIKSSNVLLDENLNAKISDFGLAKLHDEEKTHISTRIAGTIGYMAPEYAMRGYLTDKADVYSFGIVAIEIVSGKSNTSFLLKGEFVHLLDWAYGLREQGSLLKLVDPSLGSQYPEEEVLRMLHIALLCTNVSATHRPSMSSVVSMLEGTIDVQVPNIEQSVFDEDVSLIGAQETNPTHIESV